MNEFEEAVAIANKVLDRVGADPDDDIAILARQFLRAAERPALPWDAGTNRCYPPVERRAEEIYDALPYDGAGEKPAWVPNGNSFKQDEARTLARLELAAAGHKPR